MAILAEAAYPNRRRYFERDDEIRIPQVITNLGGGVGLMKRGLILGAAMGLPAFLCYYLGLDLPKSAFVALFIGFAFSLLCGAFAETIQRRSTSAAVGVWFFFGGVLIGIAQAIAAAVVSGERELGLGILMFLGPLWLGVWGAIVGGIMGAVVGRSKGSPNREHDDLV